MSVTVKANRHGTLAFRIRRHGSDISIGTKLADDGMRGRNRRLAETRATLLEEDLRNGVPLYKPCLNRLGACPARLFPPTEYGDLTALTIRGYYDEWIKRQTPPMVKRSRVEKYRQYFAGIILPAIGNIPLNALTTQALKDFQAQLFQRRVRGRHVRVKTVRNIIDGYLRALYRDAREQLEDKGLLLGDPFSRLRWPKEVKEAPDPFTEEERDKILAFYREKRPRWYPFVATLFWTGMRPGELAALRVSDVDLERGKISITKSRDAGEEGPPKTAKSRRDITVLPNLLAILKTVSHPENCAPQTTYFFRNPDGGPITTKEWPKKSWGPVLRKKIGVRYRKFYAARHTFISWALSNGMNVKAIAEYVGTSLEMIERSYGKYIGSNGLDPLLSALETTATAATTKADELPKRAASRMFTPEARKMIATMSRRAIERRIALRHQAKAGTRPGTFALRQLSEKIRRRIQMGIESGPTGNRTSTTRWTPIRLKRCKPAGINGFRRARR
jgi:integrase